jgi:excinuclease UvrABC ATPase subunit
MMEQRLQYGMSPEYYEQFIEESDCEHCQGQRLNPMSLAVTALRCDGEVTIENAECVEKSYPTFFEDLESIIIR